jgi:hypothetical protein
MTIQQTIDIPVSRKVHFDVSLPEDTPQGRTQVILNFMPLVDQVKEAAIHPIADVELTQILGEAAKRAERERTDPVYRQEVIDSFKKAQEGGPIFGGISAEDFKKECNDEWENRF